jgi:hypothetical protein
MYDRFFLLLFVLIGLPVATFADGGYWRVTGRVENIDSNALNTTRCEMANLRLRLRSRWANGEGCIVGFVGECPWGPSWGETTTDGRGRFSKTSHYFADRVRKRDILIEFSSLGTWYQLAIISDVSGQTPHQGSGNTWTFLFGTFETTAFDCPTELVPAEDDTPPTPTVEAIPLDSDDDQNRGEGGRNTPLGSPQIKQLPCGFGPNGQPGIDLSFVGTEVRHRDNQPNAPPERVTWEVTIHNSGPATYSGSGNCRTQVRAVFTIPELDDERSYELTLVGAIPPGTSRTFTSNSGNLGELSEAASTSYNVIFTIDPENQILESNEGNNQQPGCYTPATEAYLEAPCPASSQGASGPRGPNRKPPQNRRPARNKPNKSKSKNNKPKSQKQ